MWQPGATRDWLLHSDLEDSHPLPPGSDPAKDIRHQAYGLIMLLKVPVLRRVVEAILVFDHGFNPTAVTNALNKLVFGEDYLPGKKIYRSELHIVGEAMPSHVYSFNREPTTAELQYLRDLCDLRNRALTKDVLKTAGERYVRAWLVSEKFVDVTPERQLGKVRSPSGAADSLDVLATDHSGQRFGISVKNMREWLMPGNRAISDARKRGYAHDVRPWLVVPWASPEAQLRCITTGIRLTVLGAQILPETLPNGKRTRSIVKQLRAVIGPAHYGFIGERADRIGFPNELSWAE